MRGEVRHMGRLAGKTVLVTAAAQGIGRASAEAMAREGAHVIATDLRDDTFGALNVAEQRQLDVTDRDAVARMAKEIGPLDALFNCVGFVHHFLPAMIAGGGGAIINMASVASSVIGVPNRFVYGASKGAVIGLTRAVAADFGGQGIRCNAIAPGTVETPSLDERMRAQGDYEAARAAFIARQPMGRIGKPEEIAELVVYLASDAAAFMSGSVITIDGGWSNI